MLRTCKPNPATIHLRQQFREGWAGRLGQPPSGPTNSTPPPGSPTTPCTCPIYHLLVLTWDLVYTEELIELGRDPNEIPQASCGQSASSKWNRWANDQHRLAMEIKDHYIQDFDPAQLNYGVVSEHPELFDINLPELNSSNSNSTHDWNHFNSIDYHPELDQILISTRNSDEIWILDHSTTTEEAASHSIAYGKGGISSTAGATPRYGRAR